MGWYSPCAVTLVDGAIETKDRCHTSTIMFILQIRLGETLRGRSRSIEDELQGWSLIKSAHRVLA